MRRTVVRSRSSDQRSAGASDDVSQVYRHVCKVEYSHAVDRGVLHQLQAGVLRIDIDACTVHELQVFKGFFSRLPRLQQLCVARGQVALKTEPAVSSRPNSAYGTSTTVRIRQNRINAVKKATQGILHLVGKLLKTPRHCRLVSLALPGLHLTEATIVHFEEAFKACSTLRELDFREQDLSRPSTAERMFRAITASSTVQAVCLRGCKIGPRSARYLGHVLRANNERRDQLIWKGELRGEAVSKKAIRLQGLVVLDVSQNELGSEGMSELLNVLENDRWMAALNLAANGDMAESTIHEHWDRCFKINRTLLAMRCDEGTVKVRQFPSYLNFLAPFVQTYLQYNLQSSEQQTIESGTSLALGEGGREVPSSVRDSGQLSRLSQLLTQAQIGVKYVSNELQQANDSSDHITRLSQIESWLQEALMLANAPR